MMSAPSIRSNSPGEKLSRFCPQVNSFTTVLVWMWGGKLAWMFDWRNSNATFRSVTVTWAPAVLGKERATCRSVPWLVVRGSNYTQSDLNIPPDTQTVSCANSQNGSEQRQLSPRFLVTVNLRFASIICPLGPESGLINCSASEWHSKRFWTLQAELPTI